MIHWGSKAFSKKATIIFRLLYQPELALLLIPLVFVSFPCEDSTFKAKSNSLCFANLVFWEMVLAGIIASNLYAHLAPYSHLSQSGSGDIQ